MFCFVVGDVGTSLGLPPEVCRRRRRAKAAGHEGGPTDRAPSPEGGVVPLGGLCLASTLVVLRGSLLTSDRAVQRAIAVPAADGAERFSRDSGDVGGGAAGDARSEVFMYVTRV